MFTAAGFKRTFEYLTLFEQGLVCTVMLSAFTVIFGFILALILALMRLSNICPFAFLRTDREGHLREQGFLFRLYFFFRCPGIDDLPQAY